MRSPSLLLSIFFILALTATAVFASKIAPHDPLRIEVDKYNLPPALSSNKNTDQNYILGTDMFGRDVLSHAIYGAQAAMFLILVAIPLTALIGIWIGVAAGAGGKWNEWIFLRIAEVFTSIPSFMFSAIVVYLIRDTPLGQIFGGIITVALAFILVNWVGLARLVYGSTSRLMKTGFLESARSLGAGRARLIFHHILPNTSHLIAAWIIANIPAVILLEALMGYVGIQILTTPAGVSFQDLSWGGLILLGRTQLNRNPFMLMVPTLCILFISMSFTVLGGYIEGRLNPQLKRARII